MKKYALVLLVLATLLTSCASYESYPEPQPLIETGIDPASWAIVPAGEFLAGQYKHEVLLDYDYEIMVADVTNKQYADYLNEALDAQTVTIAGDEVVGYYPGDEFHGYSHEERIESGDWLHVPLDERGLRLILEDERFTSLAGYENHPMVYVTWFGARAYCDFYGWRLPSEDEWEKAARGTDARSFPWGETIEANHANFYASDDPAEERFGKQGDTTPVGFYNGQTYDSYQTENAVSPYGLYDMAGNVWQWTANVYVDMHYRHMRGGSRANREPFLRVWARNSAGPDYYSPSVGFRCARDPEQ